MPTIKESIKNGLQIIKELIPLRELDFDGFSKKIGDMDIISRIANLNQFQVFLIRQVYVNIYNTIKNTYNMSASGSITSLPGSKVIIVKLRYGKENDYYNNPTMLSESFDLNNATIKETFEKYYEDFTKTSDFKDCFRFYTNDIQQRINDALNNIKSIAFTDDRLNQIFQLINGGNVKEYIDKLIKMVDNIDTIKAYYIPHEDICSMYREADDKKREDICKLALRIEEALGNKLFIFQRMCQTNYMKYHDNWFTTTRYTQIKPFLIYDDWIVRFERVCERILVLKNHNVETSDSSVFSRLTSFRDEEVKDLNRVCNRYWTKRECVE